MGRLMDPEAITKRRLKDPTQLRSQELISIAMVTCTVGIVGNIVFKTV